METSTYPLCLRNVYGSEIAIIYSERVEFINESPLKDSLECSGIHIPESKWGEFNGRKVILIKDPQFSKALCEVYFPYCLRESGYSLENLGK